jgi:hypothetical protein
MRRVSQQPIGSVSPSPVGNPHPVSHSSRHTTLPRKDGSARTSQCVNPSVLPLPSSGISERFPITRKRKIARPFPTSVHFGRSKPSRACVAGNSISLDEPDCESLRGRDKLSYLMSCGPGRVTALTLEQPLRALGQVPEMLVSICQPFLTWISPTVAMAPSIRPEDIPAGRTAG